MMMMMMMIMMMIMMMMIVVINMVELLKVVIFGVGVCAGFVRVTKLLMAMLIVAMMKL